MHVFRPNAQKGSDDIVQKSPTRFCWFMGKIVPPIHCSLQCITTSTKDGGNHRGVVQEKSEPLQDYIEHFNKEAIQVPEVNKLIDHIWKFMIVDLPN